MRRSLAVLTLYIISASASAAQLLPVGDGHVTDHPAVGNVYPCQTTFRGGGARHEGPWFHGAMWSPAEKPHVGGRVLWPDAKFSLTHRDDVLAVAGNWLPVKQPTGTFPIARSDSVYKYDTNPNGISAKNIAFEIPSSPVRAAQPGCLSMGMIGFTETGVAIYNALDAAGRDAAAHEVQDLCDGHPQGQGQYHYHSTSPCLPGADDNKLVGWALDGYPIFGMRDAKGALLTNEQLDACHGRAESVTVSGRTYNYAYRLTKEYPYTLGCYSGVVAQSTTRAIRQGMGPPKARR